MTRKPDPVLHSLENAPEDDEPETEEERAAVVRAKEAVRRGEVISDEEFRRSFELDDEPVTSEERAEIEEGLRELDRGEGFSTQELRRRLGLKPKRPSFVGFVIWSTCLFVWGMLVGYLLRLPP